MMWGYGWNGMGSLWMILGSLFWLAILGVVIWALVRLLSRRADANATPPVGTGPSAMDILRQRYARGEIDADTFAHMRERLEGSNTLTSGPRDTKEPSVL
jgi:putative membrane protein